MVINNPNSIKIATMKCEIKQELLEYNMKSTYYSYLPEGLLHLGTSPKIMILAIILFHLLC